PISKQRKFQRKTVSSPTRQVRHSRRTGRRTQCVVSSESMPYCWPSFSGIGAFLTLCAESNRDGSTARPRLGSAAQRAVWRTLHPDEPKCERGDPPFFDWAGARVTTCSKYLHQKKWLLRPRKIWRLRKKCTKA